MHGFGFSRAPRPVTLGLGTMERVAVTELYKRDITEQVQFTGAVRS